MLILYNKNALPKDKEIIKLPWYAYFKSKKIANNFNETDRKIVEDVEKTSLSGYNTIHGKFSNVDIELGCLSDGCKTLLSINNAIKNNLADKYVFNITDCGGNAVSYLATEMAKDKDVHAYLSHSDFGNSLKCCIKISDNDTEYSDAMLASSDYTDLISKEYEYDSRV